MSSNVLKKDFEESKQIHTKVEPLFPRLQEVLQEASDKPTCEEHEEYLSQKGLLSARGVKFGGYCGSPALIVPIKDLNGELLSIQYIFRNNSGEFQKRFHKDADKSGGFFAIDTFEDGDTLFIVEGLATGFSLHQILCHLGKNDKFKVICAFSAQDIPKVVQVLKKRFDYSEIIAAPDADKAGDKVAKECQDMGVYPIFPPMEKKGNDWNDVLLKLGIEGAAEEFERSLAIKGHPLPKVVETTQDFPEIENILKDLDEDPFKDFSMENFPPVLRTYIQSICETTEAHPIMIVMSVLCTLSSLVGTKAYLPKGEYFQALYANIWSLCINKSGGFKTTALNKGAEIAISKDREILKRIKQMEKEEYEQRAFKKPTPEDIEAFERKILQEELKSPMLPNRQTTEFLMQHLSEGHEGMVMASELGEWLRNMDKSHNGDLKQIFTLFYDCDIPPYRYCTKSSGSYTIDKPFITINAVSTVDWVQSHVKADDIFSGFFARFLLFTPPYKETIPPARPIYQKGSDEEALRKITETFENMDPCKAFSIPKSVGLQYDNIHNALYQMVNVGRYDDRCRKFLEPYLKRWSPYVLKLAMLIRIVEDPFSNELSETSLKAASEIIRLAIKSTAKLFEKELGESKDQRKQRIVYDWMVRRTKEGRKILFSNLLKSKTLDGGSREYEDIVETLINSGKIECCNPEIKQKKERKYTLCRK